jgi:hypothetical protein
MKAVAAFPDGTSGVSAMSFSVVMDLGTTEITIEALDMASSLARPGE